MIRRWEVVDIHHRSGAINHVSRHFTRRGAEYARRLYAALTRPRETGQFELRVQRREGSQ